ncbi:MAG: hypothetical protein AB1Z19_06150 [Eubacteriales bacterium]
MSEINQPATQNNNETSKKEMSKGKKITLGVVLGLLTVLGITLSGAVNEGAIFRTLDDGLKTVLRYLWVGFFLVYIFWFRSIETNKGYTMKQGRFAYLIVIAVYLVVMLIVLLTGSQLPFGI